MAFDQNFRVLSVITLGTGCVGVSSFETIIKSSDNYDNSIIAKSEYPNDEIMAVNNALDASGNVIGYVITVTSHEGSQADITLSVGIQNDGTINGYSITSMSETPGLGVLVNEDAFKSQFNSKKTDSFCRKAVNNRAIIGLFSQWKNMEG